VPGDGRSRRRDLAQADKATPSRVSFKDTQSLAVDEGFLCRSAFEENGTRADNTQHVQFGDLIHLYFSGGGTVSIIGTFQIIGPNKHAAPGRFGKGIAGTALFEIADAAFETKLATMPGQQGYAPDPVLKKMTGWILQSRPDVGTPEYADAPFKNQATLVKDP
jgi:hypothetical protein